jgi:hypothetical protein
MSVTRNLTQVLPKADPNLGTRRMGPRTELLLGTVLGMMVCGIVEGMRVWQIDVDALLNPT